MKNQVEWKDKEEQTCTAIKLKVDDNKADVTDVQLALNGLYDNGWTPTKIISTPKVRGRLMSLLANRIRSGNINPMTGERTKFVGDCQGDFELCIDDRCKDYLYIVYVVRDVRVAQEFAHLDELP